MTPQQTQQIVKALDVSDLPKAEQEEFLIEFGDMVFRRAIVELVSVMDEQAQEDFAALMDRDAPEEEVQRFLEARVPNAQPALDRAFKELADDILAVTKK